MPDEWCQGRGRTDGWATCRVQGRSADEVHARPGVAAVLRVSPQLVVIVASTREGRFGPTVAEWFLDHARALEAVTVAVPVASSKATLPPGPQRSLRQSTFVPPAGIRHAKYSAASSKPFSASARNRTSPAGAIRTCWAPMCAKAGPRRLPSTTTQ